VQREAAAVTDGPRTRQQAQVRNLGIGHSARHLELGLYTPEELAEFGKDIDDESDDESEDDEPVPPQRVFDAASNSVSDQADRYYGEVLPPPKRTMYTRPINLQLS